MKMKSIVLLAVALGCGFVAMYGVQQSMSKKDPAVKTKRILVVRTEIKPQVKIDATQVTWEDVPLDKVPEGAITEVTDYDNRASKFMLAPKTPITKPMLTEKGKFGLSSLIPEGLQMYTIKVNSTQAHSGLLKPGDRIDILVTYKKPGDPRPQTKTVLEMIEVLAVGSDVAAQSEETSVPGNKPKIENLSVLVAPDQAPRLSQAQAKGDLHLTLRNPNDKTRSNANLLTDEDFEQLEAAASEERRDESELPPHLVKPAETAETDEPPEPVETVADVPPKPPAWVITIFENDAVRTEEILADGPALTPEPVVSADKTPGTPTPAKGATPKPPKGPAAKVPTAKAKPPKGDSPAAAKPAA